MVFSVVRREDDRGTVLVTGNHPLAGENLSFAVDILEVRSATDEEKERLKKAAAALGHPLSP